MEMVTREYRGERVLIVAHQVIVNCLRYLLERMDEAQILAIDRAGDVPELRRHLVRVRPDARQEGKLVPELGEFRRAAARGGRAGDGRARRAGGAQVLMR